MAVEQWATNPGTRVAPTTSMKETGAVDGQPMGGGVFNHLIGEQAEAFLAEHDGDGGHGAITATSVTTTGDVTVGDDLTVTSGDMIFESAGDVVREQATAGIMIHGASGWVVQSGTAVIGIGGSGPYYIRSSTTSPITLILDITAELRSAIRAHSGPIWLINVLVLWGYDDTSAVGQVQVVPCTAGEPGAALVTVGDPPSASGSYQTVSSGAIDVPLDLNVEQYLLLATLAPNDAAADILLADVVLTVTTTDPSP